MMVADAGPEDQGGASLSKKSTPSTMLWHSAWAWTGSSVQGKPSANVLRVIGLGCQWWGTALSPTRTP